MVSKGQKMETTHFTCMGKGHGAPVVPATLEEWKALRREPHSWAFLPYLLL